MPLPALIGLGVGLAGAVGKMFGRGKANRSLNNLIKQDPTYSADPNILRIANERRGLANTLLNARMPGAASVERNIYTNQANQLGRLDRNATDAGQALALAAGIGGQTDSSFNQLGINEAQDYYNRLGNWNDAGQNLQNEYARQEGNKYNDQVRRFGNMMQIEGAKNENRQNTWGDISNMGFGIADFAMAGGFGAGNRSNGAVGRHHIQPGGVGGMQRTAIGNPQFMPTSSINPQFRLPIQPRPFTPFNRPPQQFPQYNQIYYGG